MKKVLAVLLALAMVFCLAACGKGGEKEPTQETYEIAFVTDVGQLMDGSFNQGTWEGVENYAKANNKTYKYYQPANGSEATDDDRYEAMKAAVDNGAKIVVCAGFLQDAALEKIAAEATDVSFVFIDGWPTGLANIAGIAFKEEQCGYLAGYAVVKEGYTKLGYSGGGGGDNAACCRYGYGFVQGANAAAAELGKTVDINYTWQYGATFSPSTELKTLMDGWYSGGTEIVFAAGGKISDSIFQAAEEHDGKGIGVDVDQSAQYPGVVITSALKGLSAAVEWALDKFYAGNFSEIANVPISLGAAEGSVGLPTETWMLKNYTVEEYQALLAKIVDGSLVVDNTLYAGDSITGVNFSNVNVHYY